MNSETMKTLGNQAVIAVVKEYCRQYPALRQEHESLSNFDFQRDCGLRIKVPQRWCVDEVIQPMLSYGFKTTTIIYHSAADYDRLAGSIGDVSNVSFISWHEIYFAIYNKSRDTRPLMRVNSLLSSGGLVVVTSSSFIEQEVMFHIQTFCDGCLVALD